MTHNKPPGASILQALIFFSLLPYPSVFSVGNTVGVTPGLILATTIVVLRLPAALSSKSFVGAFSFMAISSLAAVVASLSGGNSALSVRGLFAAALVVTPLLAASALRGAFTWRVIAPPLMIASVIHLLVAALQIRSFGSGDLPLMALFSNPSFADLGAVEQEYSLYVQRPFGLTPEPSAMASLLGPVSMILLLASEGSRGLSRRMRFMCRAVALALVALVVISGSVYSVFLLAALAAYTLRSVRSGTPLALVLAPFAGWLGWTAAGIDRLSVSDNASFEGRFQSLLDGASLLWDQPQSLLVGVGPGGSVAALVASGRQSPAIHSIVLTQAVELGLIALVLWGVLGVALITAKSRWKRWCFVVWLAGPLVTTGYSALAGLWVLLSLLVEDWAEKDPHEPSYASDSDTSFGRSGAHLAAGRAGRAGHSDRRVRRRGRDNNWS